MNKKVLQLFFERTDEEEKYLKQVLSAQCHQNNFSEIALSNNDLATNFFHLWLDFGDKNEFMPKALSIMWALRNNLFDTTSTTDYLGSLECLNRLNNYALSAKENSNDQIINIVMMRRWYEFFGFALLLFNKGLKNDSFSCKKDQWLDFKFILNVDDFKPIDMENSDEPEA